MDLIIIFLAKNGKLILDHTDPLNGCIFQTVNLTALCKCMAWH